MTVVAALDLGESILLAADSLVTEDAGVRKTRQKLHILPSLPIAWGFSGDESIGFQFRDWFMAQTWAPSATWRDIANAAVEELSRLNGRQRHLNKLAGVETKDDDLTTVLMAGYVGGVADIFELSNRGIAGSVKHNEMAAIGSGHPHATIAFIVLKNIQGVKIDLQTFGFIMEIAAKVAPLCGLPVRMLRIEPAGVSELTKSESGIPPAS